MFGVQVLEVQVWYICWGLVLKVWGLNELNETPNCLNEPKTPNSKPKNPKRLQDSQLPRQENLKP